MPTKTTIKDRANVNETQYNMTDLPSSGFNLGYDHYSNFVLGRLHVGGYQHTMPADNIQGANFGNFTLKELNVPMLSPIDVSQHNFYIPYRAIDRSFEDALAPSKYNGMNASWHVPTFTLAALADQLFHWYEDMQFIDLTFLSGDGSAVLVNESVTKYNAFLALIHSSVPYYSPTEHWFDKLYVADLFEDILNYQRVILPKTYDQSMTLADVRLLVIRALFGPFIGPRSLLDQLGYNYLRYYDMVQISKDDSAFVGGTFENLDNTPLCEYAIRAYYATWYEHYRNPNLEPVSSDLPKWKDFSSQSLLNPSAPGTDHFWLVLLLNRIRPWTQDLYTTAQTDDISRHVYAPILTPFTNNGFPSSGYNYLDAENHDDPDARHISSYSISFKDPLTGNASEINCPLPSIVNDALLRTDLTDSLDSYRLDLFSLRSAQWFEKYLKRIFVSGDEYKDHMLSQYGSEISDARINRPTLLSSSLNGVNYNQQMANVTTDQMQAGSRTATGTLQSAGDGYSLFAEEFGIVLNIVSFMPRAQYAGLCPQHLLYKEVDFPKPLFAHSNEECGRIMEIATSGLAKTDLSKALFGHYPYAHAYRSRVDEVHGEFLDEQQNWTFRRFFGMDDNSLPKLNYRFIHCRPNTQMFAGGAATLLNSQLYGNITHVFTVQRRLPVPVEDI